MIELRTESSLDFRRDRLLYLNAGLMQRVRNAVVYVNVGHSLFVDDGAAHTYAGVGMKLQIEPKKRAGS